MKCLTASNVKRNISVCAKRNLVGRKPSSFVQSTSSFEASLNIVFVPQNDFVACVHANEVAPAVQMMLLAANEVVPAAQIKKSRSGNGKFEKLF